MTRSEVIEGLKERFGGEILELFDKSPHRLYVEIAPGALAAAASYLFKELAARFNIASGLDTRDHLEILYHFSLETIDLLVSLRVRLSRENPSVASLSGLIKGAEWIEREIHEMLGIDFDGHPNLKRLLLAEEWPEGVYPLRADYREWDPRAVRNRGV